MLCSDLVPPLSLNDVIKGLNFLSNGFKAPRVWIANFSSHSLLQRLGTSPLWIQVLPKQILQKTIAPFPCIRNAAARIHTCHSSSTKGKKEKKEKKESLRHSYELVNYRPPAGALCIECIDLCTPQNKANTYISPPKWMVGRWFMSF